MLILVDEDGQKAVEVLCDIALKVGGLQNRTLVNLVMDVGMRKIEAPPEQTKPEGEG